LPICFAIFAAVAVACAAVEALMRDIREWSYFAI